MNDLADAAAPETQTNTESRWLTRQHVLALMLLAATVLTFYLCYAMLRPFLSALAWAFAFAVIGHPIHAWIERHVQNANLAAGISVVLVTILLIAPVGLVVQQLIQETAANIEVVQAPNGVVQWRETLASTSVGQTLLWLDEEFGVVEHVQGFRQDLASYTGAVMRESVWTLVNMLVAVFTLYFLFRDWHDAGAALRSLVPLSHAETNAVFARVHDTVHATIFGSVMMAMIQGALGGLIFWWLGLPAPVLWGVVMGLLATVPNLGAFIIWAPTAVGLMLQDQMQKGIILAVWGLIAIGLIDNILYPILVGKRLRMHSALVFFAILGGLFVFGPAGLVLGPVVFALAEALIEIWRRRTQDGRAAEAGVSAPTLVLPEEAETPTAKLVT